MPLSASVNDLLYGILLTYKWDTLPITKVLSCILLIPHTYVTLPSQVALQRITINLVVDVTGLLGAQRQYKLVCRIEQRENHRFQVDRRQLICELHREQVPAIDRDQQRARN